MRVTTRAVFKMLPDGGFVELERDSHDYDGPVAMAKGGGDQTTVQEPWSEAQPYILEGLRGASAAFRNPPDFYPGQSFVGPTPGQIAGWDTRLNYQDQVFGGQQAPQFGQATGALSDVLTGASDLGGMSSAISPFAASKLRSGFTGDPLSYGGLDAGDAYGSMLSGTPDYSGVQASIEAANAPILRQFEQDILPGLEQRASFLSNPTGGIKTLNRVLPEMGERMALNAGAITEQERLRALGAQERAAGQIAGLGAGYRQDLLGLGGLGAQVAGQQQAQALQGTGLFPHLAQAGEAPGILAQQYGDWGAGFQQQALQDQMNRFNFYQQQPMSMADWYAGLAYGGGGMGGTMTQQMPDANPLTSAAGGALAGAKFGSVVPGIGTGIGAVIGGLGGWALS